MSCNAVCTSSFQFGEPGGLLFDDNYLLSSFYHVVIKTLIVVEGIEVGKVYSWECREGDLCI